MTKKRPPVSYERSCWGKYFKKADRVYQPTDSLNMIISKQLEKNFQLKMAGTIKKSRGQTKSATNGTSE